MNGFILVALSCISMISIIHHDIATIFSGEGCSCEAHNEM